jgi:ABC-type Fe3+ transport system permease subunit
LSITQTVLVFAGIPAAVIAAVFALVYGTSSRRSNKRYRPGRPFTFTPVWFLAAPDRVIAEGTAAELPAAEHRAALPAGPLLAQAEDAPPAVVAAHGETGGASDSW